MGGGIPFRASEPGTKDLYGMQMPEVPVSGVLSCGFGWGVNM